MKYRVVSSGLKLRSNPPSFDDSVVLVEMSFGTVIELIEQSASDWWKVRLEDSDEEGFVFSEYIEPYNEAWEVLENVEVPNSVPIVGASLESKEELYRPIGGSVVPFRDLTNLDSKLESIQKIIATLDVSSSIRHQKINSDTYCNIYAIDYCFFCRVYVPRLRWTDKGISLLAKGEEVPIVLNDTVRPYYSNFLCEWFLQSGRDFGWERILDVDELQRKVNDNGGVGIICAKRIAEGKSGHIVVVVPETGTDKAYRVDGKVIYPLQSQAGEMNYNYYSEIRKDWWNNKEPEKGYSSYVFYYHD